MFSQTAKLKGNVQSHNIKHLRCKHDHDYRYTVSECIELIGYGKYHWKVVATMGMMSAADSAEIWIIGLISRE